MNRRRLTNLSLKPDARKSLIRRARRSVKRAGQASNKFFHYGNSEILHYRLIHPLLETKAAIPNALPLSLTVELLSTLSRLEGAKPGEWEGRQRLTINSWMMNKMHCSSNSKSLCNDPASRSRRAFSTVLPNRTTWGNQAKEDKIESESTVSWVYRILLRQMGRSRGGEAWPERWRSSCMRMWGDSIFLPFRACDWGTVKWLMKWLSISIAPSWFHI